MKRFLAAAAAASEGKPDKNKNNTSTKWRENDEGIWIIGTITQTMSIVLFHFINIKIHLSEWKLQVLHSAINS